MAISMTDLHWAAGFLEGEGTFVAIAGKRANGMLRASFNLSVNAAQNEVEPLEKLQRIFGGNLYRNTRNGKSPNLINRWYLNGRSGAALMMTLWTLLSAKRRGQIEDALARWKTNKPPNGPNHPRLRGEAHSSSKLTLKDIEEIRASAESLTILGRKYDVNFSTIGKIKRNERWVVNHVG